jgi:hypothetical protein
MENIKIPDGLPSLAAGNHNPGDGKACVMEYVALLNGEEWTDTPGCTNPLLAAVAQAVNDHISDADRDAALVPLIGRLFGTGVVSEAIDNAMLDAIEPLVSYGCVRSLKTGLAGGRAAGNGKHDRALLVSIARGAILDETRREPVRDPLYGFYAPQYDTVRGLGILTAMLDAYDRVTGRTARDVTPAEFADLSERVLQMANTK